MSILQEYITVDELAKLTMPLLIMHGDLDAVTHPHGAKVGFFSTEAMWPIWVHTCLKN